MKTQLTFILLLLFSSSFSQNIDPAIAKVFYTLKHKQDTSNKDSVYMENMVLLVAKNASCFSSLDRVSQAEKVKRSITEQEKNWAGPGLPRTKMPTELRKISTEEIFQFPEERKMVIKEYLMINYLYEDTLETINWNLNAEVKVFGAINCQKATTNFRGRDWVAWFATELPLETGPWKLHGLPGLIIEAYDSKKEVQFLFSGFEALMGSQNQPPEDLITLPKKAVRVNLKEINKLKEGMYSNPSGFFTAQTSATRGIIDPEQLAGFSTKKINNPIEFPQKK